MDAPAQRRERPPQQLLDRPLAAVHPRGHSVEAEVVVEAQSDYLLPVGGGDAPARSIQVRLPGASLLLSASHSARAAPSIENPRTV